MKKIIEEESNQYIDIYHQKISNKINYLSKLRIKNTHVNKELAFNQNEEHLIRSDYLYLVYNSIALQKKFEQNGNYVAVFITNTLVSSFHKFKLTRKKNLIYNKKFKEGNTINLGYKVLTSFFKGLYKNFKINNQYEKVEYLRVMEPHKSFTVHLHAMIFINIEHLNQFEKHYQRIVLNNENLGQYKFEVIRNISRSASYILKYAQKNFSSKNDKFKIYYGWKLENKIRAYTFTRQFISRDMFNKLSFHLSKNYALDEEIFNEFETTNYYELVHNFTNFTQNIIDTKTGEIKSKLKSSNEDDIFYIQLEKQRDKIKNCHNVKIIELEKALKTFDIKFMNKELEKYNLLNNFNFYVKEKTFFNYLQLQSIVYMYFLSTFLKNLKNESRYTYKINDYRVHKKHHQLARYDLIYDKRDWSLVKQ